VPDETRPGELPPDLPPEYAEAYRRAYERAYREAAGADDTSAYDPVHPEDQERGAGDVPGSDVPERTQVIGPLFADEVRTPPAEDEAEKTQMLGGFIATSAPDPLTDEPAHRVPRERPAWLVPALLAAAVVLLVLAAYAVGKAFSSSVSAGSGSGQGGSLELGGTHAPKGDSYTGSVEAVDVKDASASCQAPNSVDAAGHPISYQPRNVADGDLTTAWRCDGDGVGQKLTLRLPSGTKVAEIGLVPGYAKTDPSSGADRYAENNRVTKVRWVFSDGTAVEQRFDGSAANRDMQTKRIPPTRADRVVLEILDTTRGPRNTTAISEVRIGEPAG
jgi:hypothetical protein